MSQVTFLGYAIGPAFLAVPFHAGGSGPATSVEHIAGAPVACFRLWEPKDPAAIVKAMQAVGQVHADGTVTSSEAASLAVYLWPELGDDAGRVAAVIGAIDHARAGLANDGELSAGELLTITMDLLRALKDTIKIGNLTDWAKRAVGHMLGRKKKKQEPTQ